MITIETSWGEYNYIEVDNWIKDRGYTDNDYGWNMIVDHNARAHFSFRYAQLITKDPKIEMLVLLKFSDIIKR